VLAISMDDRETAARFKEELRAPFPFIADEKGALTSLYRVKAPLVGLSLRFTFVVGAGRRILRVDSGQDAIAASQAVEACPLPGRG
jgi:thioredoxin-dependent peroxiredoxin